MRVLSAHLCSLVGEERSSRLRQTWELMRQPNRQTWSWIHYVGLTSELRPKAFDRALTSDDPMAQYQPTSMQISTNSTSSSSKCRSVEMASRCASPVGRAWPARCETKVGQRTSSPPNFARLLDPSAVSSFCAITHASARRCAR